MDGSLQTFICHYYWEGGQPKLYNISVGARVSHGNIGKDMATCHLPCFFLMIGVGPPEVAKEALECFKDAGAPPHDAVSQPDTKESGA